MIRLESDDAALQERNTILLRSNVLESGSEAGFRDMLTSYLDSFQVPHSIVALTFASYDCSDISVRTVSALATLRFDGTVTAYDRTTVPPQMKQDTVLAIEGPDVLLDLIKYPCMALLDIVSEIAAAWKQQREVIESDHVSHVEFTPSAPSRLQISIEKVVASYFGADTATGDLGLETPRINRGYRSLTVSGVPPIAEALMNMVREQSVLRANPTPRHP